MIICTDHHSDEVKKRQAEKDKLLREPAKK